MFNTLFYYFITILLISIHFEFIPYYLIIIRIQFVITLYSINMYFLYFVFKFLSFFSLDTIGRLINLIELLSRLKFGFFSEVLLIIILIVVGYTIIVNLLG